MALLIVPLAAADGREPANAENGTRAVAFVFDGPSDANNEHARALEASISEHYEGEYTLTFPRQHRYEADYDTESIRDRIRTAREQDSVAVVIAVDPLGSQIVAESAVDGTLSQQSGQPAGNEQVLIAASLLPASLQRGGPLEAGDGLEDVIALEAAMNLRHDLERAAELLTAERFGVGVPAYLLDNMAHLQRAMLSFLDEERFAGLVSIPAGATISGIMEEMRLSAGGAEALVMLPLADQSPSRREDLINAIHGEGLATVSVFAEGSREGTAVSLRGRGLEVVGRRIAGELDGYFDGGSGFPAAHVPRIRDTLWIDTDLLADTDVEPTRAALLEARLEGIHEGQRSGQESGHGEPRSQTLIESVRTSLERNLELATAEFGVDIADAERREARAPLLPQIEAGTTLRAIDETRAELPVAPDQFSAVAEAELQQVIFSEPAWANLEIRELLVESEQFQYDAARADTAGEAAEAYIDLLQARSLVELRRRTVAEQQFNLDRAEVRRDLEEAGPEDVYRFRSEVAVARQELSDALALERAARMQLNRLADRPQRELFTPAEDSLDTPEDILPASSALLETEGLFELDLLEDRAVARALAQSPEILALEAGLSAREREVLTRQRAFYSPTIALAASVEQEYWSGGAGFDEEIDLGPVEEQIEDEFGFSPELDGIAAEDFVEDDTLEWEAGIRFSIPITTGGERRAERDRAQAERDELETELASVTSLIEQRARTAFVEAAAAAEGLRETRNAAGAAEDALELVSEAYDIGAATAADLVDAQERANEARLLVQNQTYEYLHSFAELLRAIGADAALSDYQAHHEIKRFFERAPERAEDAMNESSTNEPQDTDGPGNEGSK